MTRHCSCESWFVAWVTSYHVSTAVFSDLSLSICTVTNIRLSCYISIQTACSFMLFFLRGCCSNVQVQGTLDFWFFSPVFILASVCCAVRRGQVLHSSNSLFEQLPTFLHDSRKGRKVVQQSFTNMSRFKPLGWQTSALLKWAPWARLQTPTSSRSVENYHSNFLIYFVCCFLLPSPLQVLSILN